MNKPRSFGKVKYVTKAVYGSPSMEPNATESFLLERYLANIGQPSIHRTNEWPDVKLAAKINGNLRITLDSEFEESWIEFDPKSPRSGRYSIRKKRENRADAGRVLTVQILPSGDDDPKTSDLQKFTHRFMIRTLSDSAPQIEQVWRIGIDSFIEDSED